MRISLHPRGYALVDRADVPLLSSYRWYLLDQGKGADYAVANYNARQERERVAMHRVITGAQSGETVDHINRNGLDNRRKNLRVGTQSQNMGNAVGKGGSSQFKGVCHRREKRRWTAQIKVNRRFQYLGIFAVEEDAARAYNAAALDAWGEFARFNDVSPMLPDGLNAPPDARFV